MSNKTMFKIELSFREAFGDLGRNHIHIYEFISELTTLLESNREEDFDKAMEILSTFLSRCILEGIEFNDILEFLKNNDFKKMDIFEKLRDEYENLFFIVKMIRFAFKTGFIGMLVLCIGFLCVINITLKKPPITEEYLLDGVVLVLYIILDNIINKKIREIIENNKNNLVVKIKS